MYTWISLLSPADVLKLDKHISSEYGPVAVAKKLNAGISDAVKGLLIERNYIDKDYRSTFYNFYAKKGQRYRPDCVRLHFFDSTVTFDETSLRLSCTEGVDRLSDHYFGYMVLRPTGIATIGRSVLSPDIRKGASPYIITASHKVHLLGYKLTMQGFPSMDQHIDISVCAHTACWSILRHYSERYNVYREFLTHDITLMAHQFDPGGLVPSKGLEVSHAERVFQEAGTYPLHIPRGETNPDDPSFYRQFIAYIESGFPLFAAMHKHEHAVAVAGYGWRSAVNSGVPGLRYAWDEVQTIAFVDDNHLPYLAVPVSGGQPYSAKDIDAFIVALPEKIFYPGDAVERLAKTLFRLPLAGFPPPEQSILRYFITTGSALRQFVRERQSEFDPSLVQAIMTIPFAQFVWIVEIATEQQWSLRQVAVRAIIDATASLREHMPLWLIHSTSNALVFSREKASLDLGTGIGALHLADAGHTGFSRMELNLRPTRSK